MKQTMCIYTGIEKRLTFFYEEDNRIQIDAAVSILWQSNITWTMYTMISTNIIHISMYLLHS